MNFFFSDEWLRLATLVINRNLWRRFERKNKALVNKVDIVTNANRYKGDSNCAIAYTCAIVKKPL